MDFGPRWSDRRCPLIAPAWFLAERLGATLVGDLIRRHTVVGDRASHLKRPTAELARLWADAVALQRAAAAIAIRPGADDDLRFTTAAGHCGEAADEIQRAYPDVFRIVGAPALAAQVERLATVDATEHLLAAIAAVVHDFDVDNPGLLPTDMLAAGSAATWLGLAHYALSGRLP